MLCSPCQSWDFCSRCVQNRVEDPRYSDRSWLRGTRRWPPRLCTALEVRPGTCVSLSALKLIVRVLACPTISILFSIAGLPGHQSTERQLSARKVGLPVGL